MREAGLGRTLAAIRRRERELMDDIDPVAPWAAPFESTSAPAPEDKSGRPLFPIQKLLCIHFMKNWFILKIPTVEAAFYDVSLRGFKSEVQHHLPMVEEWQYWLHPPSGKTELQHEIQLILPRRKIHRRHDAVYREEQKHDYQRTGQIAVDD